MMARGLGRTMDVVVGFGERSVRRQSALTWASPLIELSYPGRLVGSSFNRRVQPLSLLSRHGYGHGHRHTESRCSSIRGHLLSLFVAVEVVTGG